MANMQANSDTTTGPSGAAPVALRLEVVTLPVSDVDRAKRFYQSLGWRLDADLTPSDDIRVVQFTPPRSQCSIHFGKGLTAAEPGSGDRMILAVEDIDAARDDLIGRGVDVGEVYGSPPPGFERALLLRVRVVQRPGWQSAGCSRRSPPGSPAGNGRTDMDVASLADLLHETSGQHGSFEAVAPPHDWWDWYAAYMDARQRGSTPEEASAAAGRYMAEVKHVVVSPD